MTHEVVLRERTNLRYLQPSELYKDGELADLGVVDVSFISLTKILPALWQLHSREAVLLVKPQFEVGDHVWARRAWCVTHMTKQCNFPGVANQQLGWQYRSLTWSPVTGPAGNIEYLLWLGMDSQTPNLI